MRTSSTGYARVTLLAQLRPGLVQQCRMIRAVHIVAQGAVFGGRLVLPQERAAFFSMAVVTVLIYSELLQRCRPCRSVRVVAVAANNLVFPYWMSGYSECLRTYILMAGVAHFGLGGTLSYVVFFMD